MLKYLRKIIKRKKNFSTHLQNINVLNGFNDNLAKKLENDKELQEKFEMAKKLFFNDKII